MTGPRPVGVVRPGFSLTFGGYATCRRDEDWIRADFERGDAKLAALRLQLDLIALQIKRGHAPPESDQQLRDEIAQLGNDVAFDRKRLEQFADQHKAEAQARSDDARIAELQHEMGVAVPIRQFETVEEFRNEQHRAELAAMATPTRTKAELDALDPKLKTKAQLKAELDERDPFLQAKLTGKPPVDAITAMRAGGRLL